MSEYTTPRLQALQVLRDAITGDLWLTTYAVFTLTDEVDLGTLLAAVDTVLRADEARGDKPRAFSHLFEERWGSK